ncbi:hypothetical protein BH09PLA1_BH09PLA1_04880 [soil metagenome]
MCTVSIIPLAGERLRLACNRDELLTRPLALPPRSTQFGEREALLPIDPQSGGTWIAASDAGLILTLLNTRSGWPTRNVPPRSRGEIIPAMLHCSTIDEVIRRMQRIDATLFGPFRLLVVSRAGGGEIHSDGRRVTRRRWSIDKLPLMATSSSLGDELVGPPRRELFDRTILFGDCSAESQDAFHRHAWPDRTYLSVNMARLDARTVSVTTIELSPDRVRMRYDDGSTRTTDELFSTARQPADHDRVACAGDARQ